MSLILLINGIFSVMICLLLFLYANKFRYIMLKSNIILLSTFSLYSLFTGFLRMRISIVDTWWTWSVNLTDTDDLFRIIDMTTSFGILIFLYIVTFKIKYKHNEMDSK